MATHLLAFQLNEAAGACSPTEPIYDDVTIGDIAAQAENLLVEYGFWADYDRMNKRDPNAGWANEMATYLDNYNNGEYCTGDDAD